ncbi:MAG: acetate/propionate family kinase [Deltaproteobacteria bacterium]|nr:acetate/propionate family kinase [Deltaproteobacteria bacterium]
MGAIDGLNILAVNAGSSTLKFALWVGTDPVARGKVAFARNAHEPTKITVVDQNGATLREEELTSSAHDVAVDWLANWIVSRGGRLDAVAHRIVHGGQRFCAPTFLDDANLAELRALSPLAPLHQSNNLDLVDAFRHRFPEVPSIGCFDTAFHRTLPAIEYSYALPRYLRDSGIRRFGFHGLSYQFIAQRVAEARGTVEGRIVACHLGSGVSMCGMLDGVSRATTMGFTPLEGLPMGTRSGTIDPGAVIFMQTELRLSPERIADTLYRESGLLGLSGVSSGFQDLFISDDPAASFAIDHFCYRASRELASLASAIGGIDAVVFTGGAGERSSELRSRILDRLTWLGVLLDREANESHHERISDTKSAVEVYVVPTDEESVLAAQATALLIATPRTE